MKAKLHTGLKTSPEAMTQNSLTERIGNMEAKKKEASLWKKYKKALHKQHSAKVKAEVAFGELFDFLIYVNFRKRDNGPVYIGKILNVHASGKKVLVKKLNTQKQYWVDEYWLVEPESEDAK